MTYDEAMATAKKGFWVTRKAWDHGIIVTVGQDGRLFEEHLTGFRRAYHTMNSDIHATDWEITVNQ